MKPSDIRTMTEDQMKEYGDKIPADKEQPIEDALAKLKEAHKNEDIDGINAHMDELNNVFQAASQDMYNASAQGGEAPQDQAGETQDEEVTDVDFEEVKED